MPDECGFVLDKAITLIESQLNALKSGKTAISNKEKNKYFSRKGTRRLAGFFWNKGYLIVSLEEDVSKHYQLAKQIWSANPHSWEFMTKLLFEKKTSFDHVLEPAARSNLINLCNVMQTKEMLDYELSGEKVVVTPHLTKQQRYYLSGECYEEVCRYLIEKTIRAFPRKLPFSVFRNVKIKNAASPSANENDIQIDFIVEFADRFYLFETKAGNRLAIDKWVDRTRMFQSELDRYITCCRQDFQSCTFQPFLLLPMNTLENDFAALLAQEFKQPAEEHMN